LVPHVMDKENNDYEYMLPLFEEYRETDRIQILPPDLNAKQYKGYIARTRFFIGARTHTTIAAYSNGVPTLVLGYSVKSRGIAKDIFGEEKYVIDSKKLADEDELIKQFENLIENEDEIKEVLMKTIPLKIRSAMDMGEELQKI
jgi:colanic acid/amylovoran biosynthesis protein